MVLRSGFDWFLVVFFFEHFEKGFDEVGVHGGAGFVPEDLFGFWDGHGLAVGSGGDEGVPDVSDLDDSGVEGDVFAHEAVGVSEAVVVFVMMLDGAEDGAEVIDGFEDLEAFGGMRFEVFEFFVGEFSGFGEDFVADTDFTDVVHEYSGFEDFDLWFVESDVSCQIAGVLGDLGGMATGIGVFGFHRPDEGGDDLEISPMDFLGVDDISEDDGAEFCEVFGEA